MIPGFDISEWDDHLVWMWRYSNLRFIGFYLSHGAGGTNTTWTRHWHDLKDLGWGLVPIWLPFGSTQIANMATADGMDHGRRAVARAREAKLELGAAIYLDIESPVFTNDAAADRGFVAYISDWMRVVGSSGYKPGTYCSRLDATKLLGPSFRALRPLLFPFSITMNTRAMWDDRALVLTPALADTWDPMTPGQRWTSNPDTIGCQFDWFNASRDRTIFHWPGRDGRPDGSRDVDWDMSVVADPSHPRAAATVCAASDFNDPNWLHVFTVRTSLIEHAERTGSGRFGPAVELALQPGDVGPAPSAVFAGFECTSAGVASRRALHADLFIAGEDGFIRTLWLNDTEKFPKHVWPLNPANRALRGTPLAAVSRTLDQLDVFYVSNQHRLTTQWWSPEATNWHANRRELGDPLVAGGSTIAALGSPGTAAEPSSLDVFYVSIDYTRAYADTTWNDGWKVIHASWNAGRDWTQVAIPGLSSVAAASGIAAVRDGAGSTHVVVQTRDRTALRHATLMPPGTWQVAVGPGPLSIDVERTNWWMSLAIVALPSRLLLVGMTSGATIAWATHAAGRWSATSDAPAAFSTSRPLTVRPNMRGNIDVFGVDEDGLFIVRTFAFDTAGNVVLIPLS